MKKYFRSAVFNFSFLFLLYFALPVSAQSAPTISSIADNRAGYPNSQIPKYEKLEISFRVNTSSNNPFFPYDAAPPPGITAGQGITVNAVFTAPSGKVSTQPAFYYQDFDYQVKSGQDWFYPTDSFPWKVRFTPNEEGNWKYVLSAQDAGGTTSAAEQTFSVAPSANRGFVRVSKNDSRYFEYDDGTYFPGLSYNMNYSNIDWTNPVQANQANFQKMGQNGIQIIRHWLSQWGIFSSNDVSWGSARNGPDDAGITVPYISQTVNGVNVQTRVAPYPESDVAMRAENYWDPCMFLSGWQQSIPMKPNTKYHIFIRYLIPPGQYLSGGKLTARFSGWLDNPQCADATSGAFLPLTGDVSPDTSPTDNNGNAVWSILEGTFNSQNPPFNNVSVMPRFYLSITGLDNTNRPSTPTGAGEKIFIDRVEIREDPNDSTDPCRRAAGSGSLFLVSSRNCGINVIGKPWMSHYQYVDQQQSARFDKVVDLAKQNGVYLKLVVLEKNEYISNRTDYNGNTILDGQPACSQNPIPPGTECPGNRWFYGNWRSMTKIRWLQTAWFRYLQARWGYSPNIHSWELVNEGDPWNGLHYSLADEMAKYMHQFGADSHLATTSFWHSFPKANFWANSNYPNPDYADVYRYIFNDQATAVDIGGNNIAVAPLGDYTDTAAEVQKLSMLFGAKQQYGVNKPVMRGETGFVLAGNTDGWDPNLVNKDLSGIWLYNYIWAGINPGGLIESYWYDRPHIWNDSSYYGRIFDHRDIYGTYYRFIKDVPLSNGKYVDAAATVTDPNLRVWGQKDTPDGKAHLWIANPAHTWSNVVNKVTIAPISATITLTGFTPNKSYPLEWWDTYSGAPSSTTSAVTDGNGNLTFSELPIVPLKSVPTNRELLPPKI